MNFKASLKKCLGVVAVFAVASSAAHAVNIAQFSEFNGPPAKWSWTDNGSGTSTFTVTNLEVDFYYQVANTYDTARSTPIDTAILADVTITGSAPAHSGTNFGGIEAIQDLTINSLTFKALTPELGHTNLLTVVTTPSLMSGSLITGLNHAASLSGTALNVFSSNFLTIPYSADSTSISLTNLNETNGGLTFDNANGVMGSFLANATGTFSLTAVPEPAPTAALAVGMLGLLALMLRARGNRRFNGAAA
jgi:hypothetical protein